MPRGLPDRQWEVLVPAGAALLLALTAPAMADDLREALVLAYRTNPTLEAARANQRGVDENVPIARASGLPSLGGTASYTEFLKKGDNNSAFSVSPDRALNAGLSLSIPIYSGGSVRNSVRAAETRVKAGQADLRGTESGLFAQVVAAYVDVIRDQAIVGLSRNNVQVLDVNLSATRDRFEIGDLTRTDVAQSQARLSAARSDLRTAEANLASSRETYIRLVGKPPLDLQPPPPLPNLPATPDEAVDVSLENNPDLLAARERSKAAAYDTEVAGSGRLPRISVFSGVDYINYLDSISVPPEFGSINQRQTTAQAGVRATIPLFQGGLPAAQQRQAQAREGATLEQEIGTEREVIATVRTSYQQWKAANEIIVSSQSAVDAASLGLEGVRAENSVGNRTILDILNAEQELLNAQVQLVRARRNAYVAGFNLLAAMGRAEVKDLGLDGGALYDPNVNYKRVRGIIWDWQRDPAPVARSTRTVDTPAQDGSVSVPESLKPSAIPNTGG
jgi:type I secretion outer membrane protein, TolC family